LGNKKWGRGRDLVAMFVQFMHANVDELGTGMQKEGQYLSRK